MTSYCDVTPWCHTMTSHVVMMLQHRPEFSVSLSKWETLGNHVFWPGDLDLWPMTLIFKLIQEVMKVKPCTKFRDHRSNGSAGRVLTEGQTHTHTDTQTDKTVFITSTADAGGNKQKKGPLEYIWSIMIGLTAPFLLYNHIDPFFSQSNNSFSN